MSNPYRSKTDAELQYIMTDANEAAVAMHSLGNDQAEAKYLDQVNHASSELYRRRQAAAKSRR